MQSSERVLGSLQTGVHRGASLIVAGGHTLISLLLASGQSVDHDFTPDAGTQSQSCADPPSHRCPLASSPLAHTDHSAADLRTGG